MSFDTSRIRFDPWKDYSGVVMEQGRVQLDSDWNEWLAQLNRRIQAGTLDSIGRAAYPATTPYAFQINFDGSGSLAIGPGRMYVDGLLAENHGDPATAVWDPALAELSNTPQPPPASETGAIGFLKQPYYSALAPNATLPTSGSYVAYLDVWTRAVDYLQDPDLVEPAVAVDTTARLQTAWQVGLAPVPADATCATAGSPWPAASSGLLTTAPATSTPSGPCCLTDNTGYTGPENQHYRVEIHQPGAIGIATFKWSRDNASVETAVTGIAAVTNSVKAAASQLAVLSLGRDQVLGFRPGDWVEILDDALELAGQPGELHRIDTIDAAGKTITLDAPVDATKFPTTNNEPEPGSHTRIRRWDQSGKVFESDGTTVVTDLGAAGSHGDILIPAAGTVIVLEYGVTVAFDVSAAGGEFNTGDFWTFAARTDGSFDQFAKAPPRGVHHRYIPLAMVNFDAGSATDCRVPWQPGDKDSCGCCTVTVGDGRESVGQYTSINAALKALPGPGGEVCILPGRYYEYVFVQGLHDVVIRGCGYQTRLASPSALPAPPFEILALNAAAPASAPTGGNVDGAFNAILSITASQHIRLCDFAVEAADNEVGILIDGAGGLVANPSSATQPAEVEVEAVRIGRSPAVIDVTARELFLTGSTLPAILARRVELLCIEDNRILMQDVPSLWPSVYVSGVEMHLDRNEIGIQSTANIREWLAYNVTTDLQSDSAAPASTSADNLATAAVAEHLGGVMIAGPSKSVFVRENLIEGGRFNGITLGNFAVVDQGGVDTGRIIGVRTVHEDPCSTTGTLEPPGSGTTGVPGSSVVAGEPLVDIVIDRNRIGDMALCGIGPAGFFDLPSVLEVITIENLTITNNDIRNTLLRRTETLSTFGTENSEDVAAPETQNAAAARGRATGGATVSSVGSINSGSSNPYGAICVPAVENLVIRDNVVTNFGPSPGARANGIFVLNGEGVDISRNQIVETRDWKAVDRAETAEGLYGGIVLVLVTPPAIGSTASSAALNNQSAASAFIKPIYQPGMPALRVEENVVRIAMGQALVAVGFGPFAISNNHFSCGGAVRGGTTRPLAQTVLIVNLGASIESAKDSQWTGLYETAWEQAANPLSLGASGVTARALATSQNGTVIFSQNICQLESRIDRQQSITSLTILSLDHVAFAGNHCWVDALGPAVGAANPNRDAYFDAVVVGGTVNVTGNRFQEALNSVFVSCVTFGLANITSQNISTYCLLVKPSPGAFTVASPNVSLLGGGVDSAACARLSAL